jgi:uncharacterized membrane protein YoaK (UPF0700 family)
MAARQLRGSAAMMTPSPVDRDSTAPARQAEEAAESALSTAMLLSLSGGFLDAFTYVGHGGVFANAMTGNVVLLGVFAADGEWARALSHIPPIIAFLAGVFAAHASRLIALWHGWRGPLINLAIEILFLLAVAILPRDFPDLAIVLGISFVAALQNSSFTRVVDWSYNSVMTTGNLRRFAEGVFAGTLPRWDPASLRFARTFGLVCLAFLVGAFLGGFATSRWHNLALLICCATLTTALALCWWADTRAAASSR